MKLVLAAAPEEVMRAVAALRHFGRDHGVDARILQGLALALEECATNIVRHGLSGRREESFDVAFAFDSDELVIELRDGGPPFDPTAITVAEAAPGEELRDDGGWGTHLVRHYVDAVDYARLDGRNVLRLRKRLPAGGR